MRAPPPPPGRAVTLTVRQRAAIGAAAGIGLAAGLAVYTFGYARGVEYLRDDPAACANCHVMSEHFAAWQRGSHRIAATCNDCHTPHDVVGKYTVKALNGFWHSFYFTTGNYPDPLRITERNRRVTEEACRYCHAQIVDAIDPPATASAGAAPAGVRVARAGVAPTPPDAPVAAALAALQGGVGEEPPPGRGAGAHADDRLSCIRCHTYVGHWVR
jgi:cytochrome c nitrite reductase small subunit